MLEFYHENEIFMINFWSSLSRLAQISEKTESVNNLSSPLLNKGIIGVIK